MCLYINTAILVCVNTHDDSSWVNYNRFLQCALAGREWLLCIPCSLLSDPLIYSWDHRVIVSHRERHFHVPPPTSLAAEWLQTRAAGHYTRKGAMLPVCVVARGRELGVRGGASSTMTSPANDHLCLIHAPCNMCAFHSFPSYMHLQCTCLTVLAPRQHAHTHTHTKKRCVYHLMPGSILAAGPVSVLESLEVSAVSCQRASAVWRIKSPACLYFSRPLLPWKQVPRISHFFIFLYTIHITPPPPPPPFMLQLPCCFLPPQPAA